MAREPLNRTNFQLPPDTNQSISQIKPNKLQQILIKLDFFSYVPEPQAYPVSTRKSKIGSLIFLIVVVSYLTYDFYKFMTSNSPIVNSFQDNVPLDVQYDCPQIAFGFVYGPNLNFTLNDPTYFTFQFLTIQSSQQNGSNVEQRTQQTLLQNCNPQWLGQYNNIYQNLTCVNANLTLMNVPTQNPNSIIQRLLIIGCQSGQNITCQNQTSLYQMTSGGRFYIIINLPAGFDYKTGQVEDSSYSVEIYQFFLVPGLYSRIFINYYPYQFTTYPTYLTTWNEKQFLYLQSFEPVTRISNVSTFNPYVMIAINFQLYSEFTLVKVKYQTLIERISQWGALASLIMTIFGICCLTYNKNKFLQKNPTWASFDQGFREKAKIIQIQLQNTEIQKNPKQQKKQQKKQEENEDEDDDIGGIAAIRKKLQKNKKI